MKLFFKPSCMHNSQQERVFIKLNVLFSLLSLRNGRIFCQFMLYINPQPSVPTTSSEPIENAFRNALHETSTNNTKKFYLDNKYVLNNDSDVDQITFSSIVGKYKPESYNLLFSLNRPNINYIN